LGFQPQAQHEALQQARQAQSPPAFWKKYAKRSGIEGTLSQAVRVCEVRRSRYMGLAKTRLQMLATAAAINLHRVYDWLTDVPRSLTRTTLFACLAPEPSLVPSGWQA
jgi:transposase